MTQQTTDPLIGEIERRLAAKQTTDLHRQRGWQVAESILLYFDNYRLGSVAPIATEIEKALDDAYDQGRARGFTEGKELGEADDTRVSNQTTEIPITRAMIDAGSDAWWKDMLRPAPNQQQAVEDIVCSIYRAMEAARGR